MRHIHLIDTSVASDNLGDEIIVSETRAQIVALFGDAYLSSSSGHDGLGYYGRKMVESADLVLLQGTNALTAGFQRRGHFVWSVARQDIPLLEGKVVLYGVGASTRREDVHPRQARLLRRLLSEKHVHSVRDAAGAQILDRVGLKNANTSCPTLWRYRDDPSPAPEGQAPAVVFTLTRHKAADEDRTLIDTLRNCYDTLYFWPQQLRDLGYLESLTDTSDIPIVPGNLAAYDALLADNDIDVVGTRLHGGIRGLKHGRRVMVVEIDHRAREIGAATGLPTQPRDALGKPLAERLRGGYKTELRLPDAEIRDFQAQFAAR